MTTILHTFMLHNEGLEATFDLDGNLLRGFMIKRARNLIEEWCSLHKKELEENRERAENNKELNWIEPLRQEGNYGFYSSCNRCGICERLHH
jgi:ferredoxin